MGHHIIVIYKPTINESFLLLPELPFYILDILNALVVLKYDVVFSPAKDGEMKLFPHLYQHTLFRTKLKLMKKLKFENIYLIIRMFTTPTSLLIDDNRSM